MSIFETRKAKALELLRGTGMWESNYLPPAVRLLWSLGVKVPPPHFASFWMSGAVTGFFFGIVWGALMWFTQWEHAGMGLAQAGWSAAAAGLFFGLSMAGYYAWGRRKHALPAWEQLA